MKREEIPDDRLVVMCSHSGACRLHRKLVQRKTKTLTLWYWNRSLDDGLLKAVEQQFPGIRIDAQKIGGDFKSKLKTTLAAGSGGPDIVAFNDWVTELFASSDRFYDLYELGAAEIEDDFLDWKWQLGVTPEGTMIALPIDTGPTALYYRADLFEQAGLPSDPEEVHRMLSTWEDYFEAGVQLQQHFGGSVKLTDNISNIYNQINAQSETIYFDRDEEFIGESSASSMRSAWDLVVKAWSWGCWPTPTPPPPSGTLRSTMAASLRLSARSG